jgi:hypothetical protein
MCLFLWNNFHIYFKKISSVKLTLFYYLSKSHFIDILNIYKKIIETETIRYIVHFVFDKPTKVSSIIKSCRLMASIVARYKKRELNHM